MRACAVCELLGKGDGGDEREGVAVISTYSGYFVVKASVFNQVEYHGRSLSMGFY